MDQQDNIYLWIAAATTVAFLTAVVFGVMKINEYKEAIAAFS